MENKYINRYHTFCKSLQNLEKSKDHVAAYYEDDGRVFEQPDSFYNNNSQS